MCWGIWRTCWREPSGLFNIKNYHMKIRTHEEAIEGDFIYGMVTNSQSVGGFRNITGKQVCLNDGVFEVTLILHLRMRWSWRKYWRRWYPGRWTIRGFTPLKRIMWNLSPRKRYHGRWTERMAESIKKPP